MNSHKRLEDLFRNIFFFFAYFSTKAGKKIYIFVYKNWKSAAASFWRTSRKASEFILSAKVLITFVLYFFAKLVFVFIFAILSSSIGGFEERYLDRYEMLCLVHSSIFGLSKSCQSRFEEKGILSERVVNRDGGEAYFKLVFNLNNNARVDMKVEYFNFKDFLSLLFFTLSLALANAFSLKSEKYESFIVIEVFSLFASSAVFIGYYYGVKYLDNMQVVDTIIADPIIFLAVFLGSLSFAAILIYNNDPLQRKISTKVFVGTLAIIGISLFVRYSIIEDQIEKEVFISFSNKLKGFENGQFKIHNEQKKQLTDVLEKIIGAQREFSYSANTLFIEGHASVIPVARCQNPVESKSAHYCFDRIGFDIDQATSDLNGNLKRIDPETIYYYNSNIELAYLRAYRVWDFLIDSQKELGKHGITRMYIASSSHHYNDNDILENEQRQVIIRLVRR